MTIKNKNLIKYLIITIIAGAILIPASDVQAAPDTDTIKSWLQGKKIVVGKTLWLFDKTENIRVEKITSIRIIDYKETFTFNPFSKNRGTAMVEFTYATKNGNIPCMAVISYEWEYGFGSKKRYVENLIVHSRSS